jgi:hypothetical protein
MVEEISIERSRELSSSLDRKKIKAKQQQAPIVAEDALSAVNHIDSLLKFKELMISNGLKDKFRESEYDDRMCTRWLKARKFNVCKSIEMVRQHINWREQEAIENYCLDMCKNVLDMEACCYMGEDRIGRPTFLIAPSKHIPHSLPIDQIQIMMVLVLEIAIRNMKPEADHFIAVFDYDGWSLRSVDKQIDNLLVSVGQNNYPERLAEAILIQPPWYFSTVWAVVKLFLDDATKGKVTFLKKDVNQEMLKRFAPDQLPARFGGTGRSIPIKEFLTRQMQDENETLSQYIDRKHQLQLQQQQQQQQQQ